MPADVEELFARWHTQRDRGALDELVERYLPLARKLARRYAGREPYDDLVQVASVGLLKALERFDPQRGNAFSSFAVPTILGELKRYFRDTGWFAHVPRGAQELAMKVQEAEAELSARTGRSPTVQELAQHLRVSVDDVIEALEAASAHHAASLDSPVRNTEGEKETLDARAAVDRVRQEADGPTFIAGWSFGANVALREAVDDDRVRGLALVGLPLGETPIELPPLPKE